MRTALRFRPRTRSHYLSLTGNAGSYASAPDTVALSVTGDVDIRIAVALADWTPTNGCGLVSKRVGSSAEYLFKILTNGRPQLDWYESGVVKGNAATAAPVVNDGDLLAVRVTRSNNGGAGGVARTTFYTKATTAATAAADCASDAGWTQLGATVDAAAVANPTDTTNAVLLGVNTTGSANVAANLYAVVIKSGINGTVVASPDYTASFTGARSVTDAQGNSWLMAGAGFLA